MTCKLCAQVASIALPIRDVHETCEGCNIDPPELSVVPYHWCLQLYMIQITCQALHCLAQALYQALQISVSLGKCI